MNRLPGLDGLRAIAVSWVMLVHLFTSQKINIENPFLRQLAASGGFGVELFFVLSGFLITYLLLKEENQTGQINLKAFYARRAFRILPPAFTFLFLVFSTHIMLGKSVDLLEYFSAAFFFRNFTSGTQLTGHYWSLAIEEQFYLLWPAILCILPKSKRFSITLLLVLIAPLWRQLNIKFFGADHLNTFRTDLRYDAILMGCLFAIIKTEPRFSKMLSGNALSSVFSIVFSIIALGILNSTWVEGVPGFVRFTFPTLSFLSTAVAINYLIQGNRYWIDRVFNFKPLVGLGFVSYSLYIWQQPFCMPQGEGLLSSQSTWISIIIPLALATMSYWFIEKKFQKLGQKYRIEFLDTRK